jgi:hypothetical protein
VAGHRVELDCRGGRECERRREQARGA